MKLNELATEFKEFNSRFEKNKIFDTENWTFVKKAAHYSFFTPYESKSDLGMQGLLTIAAAPVFTLFAAYGVYSFILQIYKSILDATSLKMKDSIAHLLTAALLFLVTITAAILVPLTPASLLLGMFSRAGITAFSHQEDQTPSIAVSLS